MERLCRWAELPSSLPRPSHSCSLSRIHALPPRVIPVMSSPLPPFLRVLVGDMAQCVAHMLTLPELAQTSQACSQCHREVQRKFGAFKSLDMSTYPSLSLDSWTALCARLRGVETLRLVATSPLLHRDTGGVEEEVEEEEEDGPVAEPEGGPALQQLLDQNAGSLVCITICELPLEWHAWAPVELLGSWIVRRLPHMPRLRLLLSPASVSVRPFVLALLRQEVALRASASSPSVVVPVLLPQLRGLSFLQLSPSEIHRFRPLLSSMHVLRVLLTETADVDAFLRQCTEVDPECEQADQRMQGDDEGDDDDGAEVQIPRLQFAFNGLQALHCLDMHVMSVTFPVGSVLRFSLPHLVQLYFQCDSDNQLADLHLECPSLRALSVQGRFVALASPALRAERRAERAAAGEEDMEEADDEEGMDAAEAENRAWLAFDFPPSLLLSLRHSPSLRYLSLPIAQSSSSRVPDLLGRDYEEGSTDRPRIEALAASIGLGSPFAEGFSRLLLLHLSFSLLPFARDSLEQLEDSTPLLSLSQLSALFPRLLMATCTPDYDYTERPRHFRPPAAQDGLNGGFFAGRVAGVFERAWDRLAPTMLDLGEEQALLPLLLSERVRMESATHSYITLAHATFPFLQSDLSAVLSRGSFGRLEHLRILFLSAPSRAEPGAIRLILRHCRCLEYLTLLQLEGVGDEVFALDPERPSETSVCPSVIELRLKACCGHQRVGETNPPPRSFTPACVALCARVFPSLRLLEVLLPHTLGSELHVRVLEVMTGSSMGTFGATPAAAVPAPAVATASVAVAAPAAVSTTPVWPSLQTLILSSSLPFTHDAGPGSRLPDTLRLLLRHREQQNRLHPSLPAASPCISPPSRSRRFVFGLVHLGHPNHLLAQDDPLWMLQRRKERKELRIPISTATPASSASTSAIPSTGELAELVEFGEPSCSLAYCPGVYH